MLNDAPFWVGHSGAIIADSISPNLNPNTSVIVLSHSFDSKGRPILLSLKTDGEANSIELVDSNFMTSMYGRKNAEAFIKRLYDSDSILYMDKSKTQAIYNALRVQFPADIASLGFDKIIHQSRNAVNTNHIKNSLDTDSDGNELSKNQQKLNDAPFLVGHSGIQRTTSVREQPFKIFRFIL